MRARSGKHGFSMIGNLHPWPYRRDPTIAIDQKRCTLHAHILSSVHGFLHPDAISLANTFRFVGPQCDPQRVLRFEGSMTGQAIGRNADDFRVRLGESGTQCIEVDRFTGTSARVVLGIEIDYELFSSERG